MISPELLAGLKVRSALADGWAAHLEAAAPHGEITTPLRVAAWLSQMLHESLMLECTSEIWRNSAAQLRYESRRDLGNRIPGDGRRYMGRGPLQVTGRANYAMVRDQIRALGVACPDFEATPDAICDPRWGAMSAAVWWKRNNVNRFADQRNIADVSSVVNRGRPGLQALGAAERAKIFTSACKALGV